MINEPAKCFKLWDMYVVMYLPRFVLLTKSEMGQFSIRRFVSAVTPQQNFSIVLLEKKSKDSSKAFSCCLRTQKAQNNIFFRDDHQ